MVDWLKVLLQKSLAAKLLLKLIENQEKMMAQIDELKALVQEVKTSQQAEAASLADLASDVDALLALVSQQPPPTDLSEVIAATTEVRDTAKALADAAANTASKFDSSTPGS